MGDVQPTITDYSVPCGQLPKTFIEMLAACLVKYNGQVFVNMIPMSGSCESLSDFWNCLNNGNMNAETAEATLIANGFALDECGRLGLKIFADFGRLTLEGGDQ